MHPAWWRSAQPWMPAVGGGIGDGTLTNKVIGAGDPLFGSIVMGAGVSPHSFNDAGQVAFFYQLANGTTGIAVATPVPEPSAFLLMALSLGPGSAPPGEAETAEAVKKLLEARGAAVVP